MNLTKETLMRLNVEQLEGKLSEAKAKFAEAATNLSIERQKQLLKTKAIKGKTSQRK